MHEIESSLRSLVSDKASFNLLKLMLNLVAERDGQMDFSQSDLIGSDEFKQHANLNTFVVRFNGLCELICNSVIADDLMGSKDRLLKNQLQKFNKDLLDVKWIDNRAIQLIYKTLLNNASNPYKDKLSLMHLDTYTPTHTLDTTSYFQQITAYVLGIYPFDLFSYGDAVQTGKKVNPSVLENRLAQLEDGSYIKFMAFSKGFLGFQGHAMVIKKTGQTFSFFDPNSGEKFGITPEELSGYIDGAMLHYHGTHMAFMDGKEFINSVRRANLMSQSALPDAHSAPKKEEHQAANDEITIFILAKIKKIMEQGKTDDEDLIIAMNDIRIGVEQLMQQTEALSTAVHKKPTHSIEPNRHSRDKQGAELQTLDNIRFKSSISTWTSLIERKGYRVSSHFKGDKVSSVTILDLLGSGPSEKIKDCLANIGHQQPELVKNHYDLSALLFILETEFCQTACDSLHDKLFSLIKTARHAQILFHYIERPNEYCSCIAFEEDIKRPGKLPIVFNAIKTHLLTLIKTAYDFETILSGLEEAQRTTLFKAMQADLHGMIKSIGDLGDVLKHLTPKQRTIIFDAIKATLPDITHTSHNSCYDFQQTLDVLLPEQRTIIIDIMLTMLPTIHLENINVFNALHAYLSPEQATFFFDVMLDRLPDAMNNESSSIEPKLTTEQFMRAFQKLKEQSPPINALRYLLDSSKMLNANRANGVLSAEQCAILFEGITDSLTDLMPTAHDFASKLQGISSASRAIIFEIMKEKLPGLVKKTEDIEEVLAVLSPEQSIIFIDEPMQHVLEDHFKQVISKEVVDACRALPALQLCQFPDDVAKGKQDEAEAILKASDDKQTLLTTRAQFTDYSGRTFNCTAYEYAYWAKDTHMRRILESHMDDDTKMQLLERVNEMEHTGLAYEQHGVSYKNPHYDMSFVLKHLTPDDFRQLQTMVGQNSVKIQQATAENYRTIPFTATEYEAVKQALEQCKPRGIYAYFYTWREEALSAKLQFDFHSLITALDSYVNNYDTWNYHQQEEAWMKVGKAQRDVPAHVANEYCRPDRSFDLYAYKNASEPIFKEQTLSRGLTFDSYVTHVKSWFPLTSSSSGLGFDFCLLRGVRARAWAEPISLCLHDDPRLDLAAVSRLDKVRTADLTQSREILEMASPHHGLRS